MTSGQRNAIGFAMLGAGLIVLLISALMIWGGVQRWFAVVETREAFDQLRRDRVEDARKLARRAADRVPDEPTPALLAVDPTDSEALDRLVTVAANCRRHVDRQAVLAAIGLMRLAAGKPSDVQLEGTADGRLLQAIAAVRAGRDPGKLKLSKDEEPPHYQVLRAAHTVLMRWAWQEGKVSETRAHAGALLLLRPRAPEAPALHFLVGASSPVMPEADVIRLGEAVRDGRDGGVRAEAVIRAVAALLPMRRAAIAAKWPKAVEGLP